jgi:hypothetical protein
MVKMGFNHLRNQLSYDLFFSLKRSYKMKSLEFSEIELRQLHYLMLTAKFMSANSEQICGMPVVDRIISEAANHDYEDESLKRWASLIKTTPDSGLDGRSIRIITSSLALRAEGGFDISNEQAVYEAAKELAYPYSLSEGFLLDIFEELQWLVTRHDFLMDIHSKK